MPHHTPPSLTGMRLHFVIKGSVMGCSQVLGIYHVPVGVVLAPAAAILACGAELPESVVPRD